MITRLTVTTAKFWYNEPIIFCLWYLFDRPSVRSVHQFRSRNTALLLPFKWLAHVVCAYIDTNALLAFASVPYMCYGYPIVCKRLHKAFPTSIPKLLFEYPFKCCILKIGTLTNLSSSIRLISIIIQKILLYYHLKV